jgi:predicted metalloendopeptidase
MSVQQDARQSTRYLVVISQSGLGMPNRDYYLQDDAELADTRANYQAHAEKLLALAGEPDAGASAVRIVALETALAQAQWSAVENRDPVKTYNGLTVAQLKAQDIAGKADAVNVEQPTYLQKLDGIVAATPIATWKSYFTFRLLGAYAPYLSQAFVDESFAFRGKARDAALIAQVKSDPHSPSEFRVNGSLRNHPGFYEAFDVKPGDRMYLAPADRVVFW